MKKQKKPHTRTHVPLGHHQPPPCVTHIHTHSLLCFCFCCFVFLFFCFCCFVLLCFVFFCFVCYNFCSFLPAPCFHCLIRGTLRPFAPPSDSRCNLFVQRDFAITVTRTNDRSTMVDGGGFS